MAIDTCIADNCVAVEPPLPACFDGTLTVGYVNGLIGDDVTVTFGKSNGSERVVETTLGTDGLVTVNIATQVTDSELWLNATAGFYKVTVRDENFNRMGISTTTALTEDDDCLAFCVVDIAEPSTLTAITFTW